MRHYEIVASGAVPFFDEDPTHAPSSTLAFWPKKLLRDLRTWPGVFPNGTVDVMRSTRAAHSKLAAGLHVCAGKAYYRSSCAVHPRDHGPVQDATCYFCQHTPPRPSASPWSTGSGGAWSRSGRLHQALHLYEQRRRALRPGGAVRIVQQRIHLRHRLRDDPRVDRPML